MASESELAELVKLGQDITNFKLYAISLTTLWVYDYLLTVGDEIRYAWKMESVLMLVLFLLTRYLPVPFLVWGVVASWSPTYTSEMCKKTAFIEPMYITFITVFAQVVLAQRTYAITRKNKWVAGILYAAATVQFGLGACIFIHAAVNSVVTPATVIPLDSYRMCISGVGSVLIIIHISMSLAFDVAVFVFIIVHMRATKSTYPRVEMPHVFNVVGRDAEIYFVVISSSHFVVVVVYTLTRQVSQALAPVGNTVLIPMMIARIVISLKKAIGSRQTRLDLEVPSGLPMSLQDGYSPRI